MPIDLDYIKIINRSIECKSSKEVKIKEFVNQYNKTISSTITKFDLLITSAKAEYIKLNGVSYKALISYKRVKDAVEDALVRKINMHPGIMKYGDYVEYVDKNNQKNIYLVKSKIEPKLGYDETLIKICNNSLRLKVKINNKDEIIEIPCIVTGNEFAMEEGKFFNTEDKRTTCEVGYSMRDKLKYIDDSNTPKRFILNGKTWQFYAIDNITKMINNEQGVYLIKLESCSKLAEDDFVNGIAYNPTQNTNENPSTPTNPTQPTSPVYSIQGSEALDTKIVQTYTVVDKNNIPVTDKEFKFSFQQVDNMTAANLIIPKASTTNSYSLLGKSQYAKGSFILVATCKTDESIVIKKEIRVV